MVGWIKIPLHMEIGLGPGNFVLDVDPAPLSKKKGRSPPPQYSEHFYCGQTAGCIKMPFGMVVGLGPGDVVFDGDPAPLRKKGTAPTQFLAHVYCGHGRPSQILLSTCFILMYLYQCKVLADFSQQLQQLQPMKN